MAQIFPKCVDVEENDLLMELVEKKEVEHIIKSMQKEKIPSPGG